MVATPSHSVPYWTYEEARDFPQMLENIMKAYIQAARMVTRRGGFKTDTHHDHDNQPQTWLVTGQDDVVSTDIRDGSMAMIKMDDLLQVLNQSNAVADALEALSKLKGMVSADTIKEILEDIS